MERAQTDGFPVMISYWQPSEKELEKIVAGEKIALIIWGTSHPPVVMVPESDV